MNPILVAAIMAMGLSCLWDTDTLRDEATLRPDVWEVISGQFAHHGDAYYRSRIATITAMAKPDRVLRNDLAVAYIRLKEHDPAEKVLAQLRTEDAGEYEALSNFAVLRRNQGRFAEAVPLFEEALKLKPEGHLGLGDWTMRAVRWQAKVHDDPAFATREDFLGRERKADVPLQLDDKKSIAWDKLPAEKQDLLRRLNLLLRNYTFFAEGFVTLGDELASISDNSLAVYAYVRALDLNHPAADIVTQRILQTAMRVQRWGAPLNSTDGGSARALSALIAEVRTDLASCGKWSQSFTAIEAEAVAKGAMPSFEETLAQCASRGVATYLPTTNADRRTEVFSAWIEGMDLLKRRQLPEAEKALSKTAILAEKVLGNEENRGSILMSYAASLAPQGGAVRLKKAAKALEDAEGVFRSASQPSPELLDMVLSNLEKVYDALHEPGKVAEVAKRKQQLRASSTEK